MNRWLLAGAVAVILTGAGAVAASPAVAQPTVPTSVVMNLSPSGTVTYRTAVTIRGQVLYRDGDHQHAVEGTVTLDRRYLGTTTWRTVGTDVMSGFLPSYEFTVTGLRNTQYRVRFTGGETYLASSNQRTVNVARKVTGRVTEPRENVFFMTGGVSPSYARKTVALMRKKCLQCAWAVYARTKTSATSRYTFRLPLPGGGTHYFRVRVLPSVAFVVSYSPTWKLTRIM